LAEEDGCSTSSFDDDDDDDDTDDEYDDQELLLEFQKLISKQMKLQKRHVDLLCSHEELIDSYALLEIPHEVMVTTVKFSQLQTCTCAPNSIDLSCANSCCSQAKSSCDDHVFVETCDSLIASENDELNRENKMLKMELSRLKDKVYVQPSKDNRDHMVKKLEKGSTITCTKLPQINLKTSYQKINKTKMKKKAHIKCFECSTLGHFSFECPNKKNDQAKLSRRQRSLSQRRCFACKETGHNIADCPREEASK
jgi:cell division protein FtsB